MLGLLDHALAFALAIALPLYFLATSPASRRAIEAGVPGAKERDYRLTLVELWATALAVLALWTHNARPWSELGLETPRGWPFWAGSVLLGVLAGLGILQWRAVRASESTRAELRKRMAHLEFCLPRTKGQLRLFALVSLSAGLCEEIAYRGFLIWYLERLLATSLSGWVGLLAAVALSCLAFGFAHLYLGRTDALRSAGAGGLLAAVYLLTGSLWLAVALHALIDLNSGFLGWISFSKRGQAPV